MGKGPRKRWPLFLFCAPKKEMCRENEKAQPLKQGLRSKTCCASSGWRNAQRYELKKDHFAHYKQAIPYASEPARPDKLNKSDL